MEFRFRSGQERLPSHIPRSSQPHPDDLLPPPPLLPIRGGLIGGGFGGAFEPIPRPMSAMVALRRELEKERIRGEIIAKEVAERRILEEEVRRELEIERSLGFRPRLPLVDPLMLPPHPALQHDVLVERLLSRPRFQEEMLMERRMPGPLIPRFSEAMAGDPRPSEVPLHDPRRIAEPGMSRGLPAREIWNAEIIGNSTSKDDQGTSVAEKKLNLSKSKAPRLKRKAEINESSSKLTPQENKEEWSCYNCEITTTCKEHLNEHFKGKKHQKKMANLKSEGAVPKKDKAPISAPETTDGTGQGVNAAIRNSNKVHMLVEGKRHKVFQIKNHLWCPPCNVECNNTKMMSKHLAGKRHAMRVGALDSGSKSGKAEAVEETTEQAQE